VMVVVMVRGGGMIFDKGKIPNGRTYKN